MLARHAIVVLAWLVSMPALASAQSPSGSGGPTRSAPSAELAEMERGINAVLQHQPIDNAAYAVEMLARSYDRLLLKLGHRQRMNTQYGGVSGSLFPLDTTAVNDRIRVALGSRRLADAKRPPGVR